MKIDRKFRKTLTEIVSEILINNNLKNKMI